MSCHTCLDSCFCSLANDHLNFIPPDFSSKCEWKFTMKVSRLHRFTKLTAVAIFKNKRQGPEQKRGLQQKERDLPKRKGTKKRKGHKPKGKPASPLSKRKGPSHTKERARQTRKGPSHPKRKAFLLRARRYRM